MNQTLISILISSALSLCLLLGPPSAHDFAFYVIGVLSFIAWTGVLCGLIKGAVAEKIMQQVWLRTLFTGFQVYALIASGHPVLAASSFLVSFFIILIASRAVKASHGEQV
ncbi:hypothetical protein [Pseudomonas sp. NFACC37-1]|uniref:hypothetical protein n=1 Tax=Pseudomonas sp. NFACC37-1 TaxID=1566196 RepID=UPI000888A054|nr:hypothetical protein [Pseudomonas sp. NFACC37-1]SCZ13221.1 hypothetical protein SAMN03159391_05797 [Pseudomonas sp. NFACC37-1]